MKELLDDVAVELLADELHVVVRDAVREHGWLFLCQNVKNELNIKESLCFI